MMAINTVPEALTGELVRIGTGGRVDALSALFVCHRKALHSGGGGVQLCVRDYMTLLKAAGFDLEAVTYEFESAVANRILNRVFPQVSSVRAPRSLGRAIEKQLQGTSTKF